MAKTNLVKSEETAQNLVPVAAFDISSDTNQGLEGADKDSFAIPFLRVLQKISPQCDEASGQYIEGAKGGQLFNSVTGELYDGKEGVIFLPCAFQRRFLRWAPRGSDGGYKGEYTPEDVALMKADGRVVELEGRLYFPADDGSVSEKKCDRLTDTRAHYGLVLNNGVASPVLFALGSTQIKKSKLLMTLLSGAKIKSGDKLVTPPTWMNRIKVTTTLESNDQGSWYGVKFEADGFITDRDLYEAGRDFHNAAQSGAQKANFAEAAGDEVASGKF
jgi:hypothetical protein